MKNYLSMLLLLVPVNLLASNINIFTGLDIIKSEVKNEFIAKDALLTLRGEFLLNKHANLTLGIGGQDITKLRGTILTSSMHIKMNTLIINNVSPHLLIGVTSSMLVKQKCQPVFTQIKGGFVGESKCVNNYFRSNGIAGGIGIDIDYGNGKLISLKYTESRGSTQTYLRILGISMAF